MFVVEYYKNPAASDPLFPDLQMDRAAQRSHSYKISLTWRYNSFFSYVFCQINLASLGAILVVTESFFLSVLQLIPREPMEIYSYVQCHNAIVLAL